MTRNLQNRIILKMTKGSAIFADPFFRGENMNLFHILGPVMIGPSSSYTAGAARIGYVARKLLGEDPVQREIRLHGSLLQREMGMARRWHLLGECWA